MSVETESSTLQSDEVTMQSVDQSSGGQLIPLKTTLETRARESIINIYVTSVPVKQASGALE